jgi:hypothetical protein
LPKQKLFVSIAFDSFLLFLSIFQASSEAMKHSARLGLPGGKEFGAGRHDSKIMIQGIEGSQMLRVGVRGSTV